MTDKTHFEQRVRERAYYLWQQAGAPHGRDHDFWHQAHEEETRAGGVAEPAPSLQPDTAAETAASPVPHSSTPARSARADAAAPAAGKHAASPKSAPSPK